MAMRSGAERERERGTALLATLLLHALLLAVLLAGGAPRPVPSAQRTLATFDVPLPPPPPETVPPPARPDPVAHVTPGGATRPARVSASTARSVREIPDVTLQADMPAAMTAVSGDAAPGPSLATAGSGSGSGRGSGDGDDDASARPRPVTLGAAAWLRQPSNAEMEFFWPANARRRGLSGDVVLACLIRRSGRPHGCRVVSERPKSEGFGGAAVAMARTFLIRPVLIDGLPLDVPVYVPVTFTDAGRGPRR